MDIKKIIEEFLEEEGRVFTVFQCWDVEEGSDQVETKEFLEDFMIFLQKKIIVNNKNNMKCIECGKEATKRYSPDLDIEGIGMCDEHKEELSLDIIVAVSTGEWEWFEKKYYE